MGDPKVEYARHSVAVIPRHDQRQWCVDEISATLTTPGAAGAWHWVVAGLHLSMFQGECLVKLTKLPAPLALAGLMPLAASAQMLPGRHPGNLHALSDLRAARWFLYHQPGDSRVAGDEDVAIAGIDHAIGEIKKAAIDDGKDLNDHPAVDVKVHGSRLLKSIETLKRAHEDIEHEEDNPEVRELRHHAFEHIDRAIHAAGHAHDAWLHEMK
jgi:hypothetical protein